MASIDSIRASDGSGNASVATVQSSRAPAASTIVVDTVAGINDNFIGTMGTPHTFTDPVTSETITVISEATAVDFKGHVDGVNLEIDTIAPGNVDGGSEVGDIVIIRPTTQWADEVADVLDVEHNDDGTLKTNSVVTANITDLAVTTAKIAAGAATPAKRSGGFKVGNFTVTGSTTGNQSVTGVGFTPKEVQFFLLQDQSAPTINDYSYGAMDDSGNQWTHWGITVEGGDASASYSTSACLSSPSTNASVRLSAAYVSMDVDGFTFNKTSNGTGNKIIGYIARG